MNKNIFFRVTFILLLIVSIGCSSGKQNPITPVESKTSPNISISDIPILDTDLDSSNREIIGQWTLNFDPESMTIETVQSRTPSGHWKFAPNPPYLTYIIRNWDPFTAILDIDMIITNPTDISVFDVRLIVYTDNLGSRLLNPDDWTSLHDVAGGAQINPFKAFAKDVSKREFKGGGTKHTQRCQLFVPEGQTNVLVAIDFSYPTNCAEPYQIRNFTQTELYHVQGCRALLYADIFDWQDDVNSILIWCPPITGQNLVQFEQIDPRKWRCYLYNNTGALPGNYLGCVIATSSGSGSLALYDMVEILVQQAPVLEGDVITWGGVDFDSANSIAIDADGNIYVTGDFEGIVDFDPTVIVRERTSNGLVDSFICRFNQDLNLNWVQAWGGDKDDEALDIEIDSDGFIYVSGYFGNVVDFDPGPGVDEHTTSTPDSKNVYLVKYGPTGNFVWARTWGGSGAYQEGSDISIDPSDNIFVSGTYRGTADFDPGTGTDIHTSNNTSYDIFFSKFNENGDFILARTYGGPNADYGYAIATSTLDAVYIAGTFRGTVDFDPGTGTDNKSSVSNSYDVCFSKYDLSGNYIWTKIWGGNLEDVPQRMVTDNNGNVIVTGYFTGTVDFDPGTGVDQHVSFGTQDVFLSKFNSDGIYIWGRSWGGADAYGDFPFGMTRDASNNVYVTGRYRQTVDFDPSTGVDNRTSNGGSDLFLSKFDSDGTYLWAITRGGIDAERGMDVKLFEDKIYVSGYFGSTCDFNPGSGVDIRTSNGYLDAFLWRILP